MLSVGANDLIPQVGLYKVIRKLDELLVLLPISSAAGVQLVIRVPAEVT